MTEILIGIVAAIVTIVAAFFAGGRAKRNKDVRRELNARREKDEIKREITDDEVVDALTRPSDRC